MNLTSIGKVGDASEFDYTRRSWDNESVADVIYQSMMNQRIPEPLPSIAFSMAKRDGIKSLNQTYNFLTAYYNAIKAFPAKRYYNGYDKSNAFDDVMKVFNTAASRYGYNQLTISLKNQVFAFMKRNDNLEDIRNFVVYFPAKIFDATGNALSQITS